MFARVVSFFLLCISAVSAFQNMGKNKNKNINNNVDIESKTIYTNIILLFLLINRILSSLSY